MAIQIPILLGIAAVKAAQALLQRLQGQGSALPDHVVRVDGDLRPDAGYSWANETPGDYSVVWTPGKLWAERHLVS